MRVALVQLEIENNGGAAGLQALIAAIDRAASGDREPDVVVLPGGCDAGGRLATPLVAGRFSTFSETIGWKAREWGVYVVAGLHANVGGKARALSFLFDPDGDIVLRSGLDQTGREKESGGGRWHRSPVGWIGILDPQADVSKISSPDTPKENGLIAISSFLGRRSAKMDSKASKGTPVKGSQFPGPAAYQGVAGWTGGSGIGAVSADAQTLVRAPNGTLVAAADSAEDAVVHVDIELEPYANMGEFVDRHAG